MIKYLGSKRALTGVLGGLAYGSGARTAVDLFTGTTRVAQEFKRRGLLVTSADLATYDGPTLVMVGDDDGLGAGAQGRLDRRCESRVVVGDHRCSGQETAVAPSRCTARRRRRGSR